MRNANYNLFLRPPHTEEYSHEEINVLTEYAIQQLNLDGLRSLSLFPSTDNITGNRCMRANTYIVHKQVASRLHSLYHGSQSWYTPYNFTNNKWYLESNEATGVTINL